LKVICLYLCSVGEGLEAEVAMGGCFFEGPGLFFVVVIVKKGLPFLSFRRFNSGFLLSRLSLEPARIAVLRSRLEDCLALEAWLGEDDQSLPHPLPLNVTAG
jgi:hypothetical protein